MRWKIGRCGPGSPNRRFQVPGRKAVIVAGIAVFVLLPYTLAGFYLLPWLARNAIQDHAGAIGRVIAVDELRFNPLTFVAHVGRFRLNESDGSPLVAFRSLDVNVELFASIWHRAIVLKSLSLDGSDISLVVDEDGAVNLAKLLPPGDSGDDTASPQLHIGRLAVNDGRMVIEDRSRPDPIVKELKPIRFSLADFRTEQGHENRYQFSARTTADETLEWSGSFTVQPLGSNGRFSVRALRSETVQDYLQDELPVRLLSGVADLGGTYRLVLDPGLDLEIGLPAVTVHDLAIADRDSEGDTALLRAEGLGLEDLSFSLQRRAVRAEALTISGAQVIARRERNGVISLSRLVPAESPEKKEDHPEYGWSVSVGTLDLADSAAEIEDHGVSPAVKFSLAPISATLEGLGTDSSRPVAVTADIGIKPGGRLTAKGEARLEPLSTKLALELQGFELVRLQPYVQAGTMDFADLSIEPRFAAAIYSLEGGIEGLSSDPESRARVHFEGEVGKYAPVSIDGEINLLAATAYTDIAMNFRNMELTTFNPYSGKYAGYNVARGKLTTDLKYLVRDRQLKAEHHVILDRLEFGEATDSTEKVSVPVKLAVALLKDRNGRIEIQLPVQGDLDDPAFELGPVIRKALVGLLTKVVSAPFALLGSLVGGGAELAFVDFPAGVSKLGLDQAGKLDKLAAALVERPQLSLDVPQTLAADQDRRAMAHAALAELLSPAAETETERERLRRYEDAYRRMVRESPDYPPETETEPDNETRARIAYLEQTLLRRLAPNQARLEVLARLRAQAVRDHLLSDGRIAPERVFITARQASTTTEAGNVHMELKLEYKV